MTDGDTDVLRQQLAALDPMAGRDVTPLTSDTKERAMTVTTEPTSTEKTERRAVRLTLAASAVVVAGGVAAALVFAGGSSKDDEGPGQATGKKTVLQLSAPAANPAMGMCIQLSPEVLRNATYAFEGNATSAEGGTVSFDVTHWYKGGDQQVVTVTNEGTVEDSTTFEAGKTYLVTADDTGVGPCSGSGEKTAELEKMYDEAFGG